MTKTQQESLDEIESSLRSLPIHPPIGEPTLEEELLQQQGDNPDVVENELKRLERLKNDRYEDENYHWNTIYDLRKEYIPLLFYMIVGWLIIVALFVFLTGYSADNFNNPDCRINCTRFKLSDNILIAFITTTTATVIGVFIIVAKWLFPSPNKEEIEKK